MTTENLDKYPKYLRLEPTDDTDLWTLSSVQVHIYTSPTTVERTYAGLVGTGVYLILGARSTKRFDFGE